MVWLPDHVWAAQKLMKMANGGKGKGKGKSHHGGQGAIPAFKTHTKVPFTNSWSGGARKGAGKSSGQGGSWLFVPATVAPSFSKGKGKGLQGKAKDKWNKSLDRLNDIEADLKVWIGGLSKKATWKSVEKHFEETCGLKPKFSEITNPIKGTGVAVFKSAEDASSAIAAVNGSDLDGKTLEVDVWTEKEKKEGVDKPKRKFGATFLKSKPVKAGKPIEPVDPALKVWVGGLSAKTGAVQLKKHFKDNGCEPDKVTLMKRGTGSVSFKTEDEATSAIGSMSGTELQGSTLEVDVWTKAEKK